MRVPKRKRSVRDIVFPAPTKGWLQSGNIVSAPPDAAEVLENFFPTAQGARIRGGASEYADLEATGVRLFAYSSTTDQLWASTATGIFNADRIAGGGAAFADVSGFTSGDWSVVQTSTSAGDYLVAVNGADAMQASDGTGFIPVVGASQTNLTYDALTDDFVVGQIVTGGTSGATGTVAGIAQTSATEGVLRLISVTGVFLDNEAITAMDGAAVVNGAPASGSAITVTNVATDTLSQVWLFKSRLFFIEKNTLSAWYLPAVSIGGAAVELPLGAVFRRGGGLLFGATWSLDSGSGLDDVCLFVTSNGEIAVYEGTDPSSASTWSLTGVYDVSKPLNKHSWFKAGGDMAILTEDGIISVSEALQKDRAALQTSAITYPIEDAWKSIITNGGAVFSITPTLWQDQAMLLIGTSGSIVLVANSRTGAWCQFTGWDFRAGAVANGKLYFVTGDGIVAEGNVGGQDFGVSYTARYVPKFQTGQSFMSANEALLAMKAPQRPRFAMACFANYEIGSYPTPEAVGYQSGATWGSITWGSFIWGTGAADQAFTEWKVIRASGYSLAPVVVMISNQEAAPYVEIMSIRMRYEQGGAI